MRKDRNPRGYGIELALLIFKKRISLNLTPLAWNRPLFVLPDDGFGAPHFLLGPIHIWLMDTDTHLGVELNFPYNHFWWDKPKVPSGYKIVFGRTAP